MTRSCQHSISLKPTYQQLTKAFIVILADYQDTVNTIADGRTPVISLGQFGRIDAAHALLDAAEAR